MIPIITAFKASPDRGAGQAREMRVRWALEELGQAYDVRLVSFAQLKEPAHLALNPFGQIPTYEDEEVTMFESGAIVLHLAEQHSGLLPLDAKARARVKSWIFSALNTIEPPILERSTALLSEGDRPWTEERLTLIDARITKRLAALSAYLGNKSWLVDAFSAADIVMIHALRRLNRSGLLSEFPNIAAYVTRGETRPAFLRAFAAQLAIFEALDNKENHE